MAEIFTIILASRPNPGAIAPGQLGADLSLIALKHATQSYSCRSMYTRCSNFVPHGVPVL